MDDVLQMVEQSACNFFGMTVHVISWWELREQPVLLLYQALEYVNYADRENPASGCDKLP